MNRLLNWVKIEAQKNSLKIFWLISPSESIGKLFRCFSRVKVLECSAKDDINIKEIFRSFLTLSKLLPRKDPSDTSTGLKRRSSAYVSATSKDRRRADSPLLEADRASGSGKQIARFFPLIYFLCLIGTLKWRFIGFYCSTLHLLIPPDWVDKIPFKVPFIAGSGCLEGIQPSKPRSRSLIRRASRKTKQQIRDAQVNECNVS